jgi:hypothetical protein
VKASAIIVIGFVAASLSSCDSSRTYQDQVNDLVAYVKAARIGTAASVWLVKDDLVGEDRVALFFGYLDNAAACGDMVQLYRQTFPADTYVCELAN